MARPPHDKPANAVAEQGEVLVDGPDGLVTSFTPDAASLSAEAIAQAAREALSQADGKPRLPDQ